MYQSHNPLVLIIRSCTNPTILSFSICCSIRGRGHQVRGHQVRGHQHVIRSEVISMSSGQRSSACRQVRGHQHVVRSEVISMSSGQRSSACRQVRGHQHVVRSEVISMSPGQRSSACRLGQERHLPRTWKIDAIIYFTKW